MELLERGELLDHYLGYVLALISVWQIDGGEWIFERDPIAVKVESPETASELAAIKRVLIGAGLVLPSDN